MAVKVCPHWQTGLQKQTILCIHELSHDKVGIFLVTYRGFCGTLVADDAVVISHSAQCLIKFLEKCPVIENNLSWLHTSFRL